MVKPSSMPNKHIQPDLRFLLGPLGWETAPGTDLTYHQRWIIAVINSAAQTIWENCPDTRMDEIFVHRRNDHPQANFERNTSGQIVVGLHVGGLDWAKFAFQFAHEFCHLLTGNSNSQNGIWKDLTHKNKWLEEAICETASLFALRSMATRWQHNAPYPQWRPYGKSLLKYARDRMDKREHRLPRNVSFIEWFRSNELSLRADSIIRDKNCIIASQLLPHFEAHPAGWESMTFFNRIQPDQDRALSAHFEEWRKACPQVQREFVSQLESVFIRSE